VKYSNIRYGDLGTTSPQVLSTATESATESATTTAASGTSAATSTTATATATATTATATTVAATMSATDVPITTVVSDSDCGFQITENCWGAGCTVQVSVKTWQPSKIVTLTLANSATITQAWNADIIEEKGDTVVVRLASYQSSGWGFNQDGSSILPHFSCGSSSADSTISSVPASTTSVPPESVATTQEPASGSCNFAATEQCWSTGCTIQVAPGSWTPGGRFTMQLAENAQVANIWNADIVHQAGSTLEVQLANYNSDSFGFNQVGSNVLPQFIC